VQNNNFLIWALKHDDILKNIAVVNVAASVIVVAAVDAVVVVVAPAVDVDVTFTDTISFINITFQKLFNMGT
jgi:hypothetical protein